VARHVLTQLMNASIEIARKGMDDPTEKLDRNDRDSHHDDSGLCLSSCSRDRVGTARFE
jgi:hypothetical protein